MTASETPDEPSHWTRPESGRRSRGRRVLAFVLFLFGLLVVGYIALVFLGNQVQAILAGKVLFGPTAPSAGMCAPTANASTLQADGGIHWGAYFRDDLPAGTSLLVRVTLDDEVIGEQPFQVSGQGANCLSGSRSLGPLPPGTLTIRVLRGDAVEAEGTVALQ